MLPISTSYRKTNLGYPLVLPSLFQKSPTLAMPILFPRHTVYPVTHFQHNTLIRSLSSIFTLASSKRYPVNILPPPSPFLMPPPSNSLDIQQDQSVHHSNLSGNSSSSPSTMSTRDTSSVLMKLVRFPDQ